MTVLPTLAGVKTFMGITDTNSDALLNTLLAPASNQVISFLGYDPTSQTYSLEPYDGNGATFLYLRNRPITAVAALYITWISPVTPIPAVQSPLGTDSGFWFDSKAINLRGYKFDAIRNSVFVTYTAGYASIPDDIITASNIAVQALYSAGSLDPTVQGESVPGAYQATYKQDAGSLPLSAQLLLTNGGYKRVAMV